MSELNHIPRLLALLAEAVDARRNAGHDKEGAALIELGRLARLHIPVRGVLPLSDDQLFDAIDAVGLKHFELAVLRKAVDHAIGRVEPISSRDEIEVAVDQLCAILNVVYFDAGLAFGITLADIRSL